MHYPAGACDSPSTTNVNTQQGASPCGVGNNIANPSDTSPHSHHERENGGMDSLGAALAGMQMGGGVVVGPSSSSPSSSSVGPTSTTVSSSPTPVNYGSAAVTASSPFALPYNASDNSNNNNNDWGNFAEAAQAAFPSGGGSTTPTPTLNGGGGSGLNHHGEATNSDANRTQSFDLFPSPNAPKTLSSDVFRFSHSNNNLSGVEAKSPHQSYSDPSLSSSYRYHPSSHQSLAPGALSATPVGSSSFGDMNVKMRPNHNHQDSSRQHRNTESPSCSVTGTTNSSSRSVSPYTNSSNDNVGGSGSGSASARGATIQAYQRGAYNTNDMSTAAVAGVTNSSSSEFIARNPSSFAEDDRSTSGYSQTLSQTYSSHPSLATLDSAAAAHRSPYHSSSSNMKEWSTTTSTQAHRSSGSPYHDPQQGGGLDQYQHRLQVASSPPPMMMTPAPTSNGGGGGQPQQQQVLYMAVPSPDGRGQVLQPVQMVQLASSSGNNNNNNNNYHIVAGGGNGGAGGVVHMDHTNNNGSSHHHHHKVMGMGNPLPPSTTTVVPAVESRVRVANYAMEQGSSTNASNRSSFGSYEPSALAGARDDYDFGRTTVSASTTTMPGGGVAAVDGQYEVDSALAQLYASPQRPPLDALLGQVRRLSRDQVGCRLVQQALDEEGPLAASLILTEGLPFWGEAMVDPFGNYLFQKILEKISPEERIVLVRSVSPRLVNASLNLHGTRSVQKVVELCSQDKSDGVEETAADILTAALAPAAARLCIDSHGNHVIQRILLKLGPKHTRFVFDAVAASVGDVARHRHGCCVIQRCLDSPPSEARVHLVLRIVDKSLELMQDAYGNYVVQYVLDVCSDEDVAAVCESVVGRVNLLSIQKFSSNVMEKCLERCSERVKEHYLAEMSDPHRIRELMMDPFGNYVVQRALSVATHAQAIRLVEAMRPHLLAGATTNSGSGGQQVQRSGGVRNTAGGRRIIAKICRRFPNFTLSTAVPNEELYSVNRVVAHHHQHHQAPMLAASYAPIGVGGATAASLSHIPHHHSFAGDTQQHHSFAADTQHHSFAADPFAVDPFAADPRLGLSHQAHSHAIIPQTYYTLGGTPYHYEPQYTSSGGHGGFPGM